MAADASSVLRCGLCNKPFDKRECASTRLWPCKYVSLSLVPRLILILGIRVASTLKRHGYYCRSRHGGTAARSRACISCVKTKTKCDNGRPACARCTIKGIDCQYPAKATPRIDKTSAQRSSEASSDQSSALGQGSPGFFAAHDVNVNDNGSPGMYDADLSQGSAIQDFSVGYDTWDGIDWSNLLPSHMDIGTVHYNDPFPPTAMMNSDTAMIPSKLQIPMMPALNQPSIFHRQYTNVASQRVSQLILQTLKSYPLMMLRQKTPPPFIHPHLLIDTTTNDMEAWHNCMSLVHMMNGGIHGSRKLFWRNVRMECDRFCEQVCRPAP